MRCEEVDEADEEPIPEIDWTRNAEGPWVVVAQALRDNPPGTPIELWWYGSRTAPNGAWMRDKCKRLGFPEVEITHYTENGEKRTFVAVPKDATCN